MGGSDALWEPMRIGAVEVPNRVFVSAHNTAQSDEQQAAYLAERAAGGAGLIVMGAVPVHHTSLSSALPIPAWEDQSVPRFRTIADGVHRVGGLLFGQLFHAGQNDPGNMSFSRPHPPMAPSAIASAALGRIPKAMEHDDIDEIVEAFATSASHLQEGGFDGVEVHGAHGYLIHGFLSPTMNKRTDEYGGPPENRVRFALRIARAIRDRCGADFPMILRLSLDERLGEQGATPETSVETLELLHRSGLFDGMSISGSVYASLDELLGPASSEHDAVFRHSAVVARRVVGDDVPLMLAGSVMTLDRAAEIVESGDADFVAMTRAQIADPQLVRKGQDGRADEIRTCVRANQGCWRGLRTRTGVTCTVNPFAGRELEWGPLTSADTARRVVVVGGGPAGLQAADIAAKRGHDVTLLEADSTLGGQLRYAGALPGRSPWLATISELETSLRNLGARIELGQRATPDSVADLGAEAVIVATGSSWDKNGWTYTKPHLEAPTIEHGTSVLTPVEAIIDPRRAGSRVIIIDDTGDYVALGLAELLAEHAETVQIISPRGSIGEKTAITGEASYVIPRILRKGVEMHTGLAVSAIDSGGLTATSSVTGENRRFDSDSVVMCMNRSANEDLYFGLRERGVATWRIGDALAPREVDDAMYEATALARTL